jgi:transposase
LMPAKYVRPYSKGQKNDFNDAEAIAEAVQRPTDLQALHRVRERLVSQRTGIIRSRTSEGRERAKAKGVVMGRKPKLTHHQRQEAIARREAGEPLVDIGRSYNVSHSTISRL